MLEENFTRRQEPHATRRSIEEASPELLLEVANLAAHRGLGDRKPPGGAAHVLLLGHGHEIPDLAQAHEPHLSAVAAVSVPAKCYRDQNGIGSLARLAQDSGVVMVEIFAFKEQEALRRAGRVAAETLSFVGSRLAPGVTTADIDHAIAEIGR